MDTTERAHTHTLMHTHTHTYIQVTTGKSRQSGLMTVLWFICLDFYVFLVSFCSEGEFDGLGEGDRRSYRSREVKNVNSGTFLMVHWLRICLATQRIWV